MAISLDDRDLLSLEEQDRLDRAVQRLSAKRGGTLDGKALDPLGRMTETGRYPSLAIPGSQTATPRRPSLLERDRRPLVAPDPAPTTTPRPRSRAQHTQFAAPPLDLPELEPTPAAEPEPTAEPERPRKRHASGQQFAPPPKVVSDERMAELEAGRERQETVELRAQRIASERRTANRRDEEIGAVESFFRAFEDNPVKSVPFLGSIVEAGELAEVYAAAKAIESGTASEQDRQRILLFHQQQVERVERDQTIPGRATDILLEFPAFAGEIVGTGGLFTLGKKAVQKTIQKGLREVVGNQARKTAVARAATATAGTAAGAALQAPAVGPGRMVTSYLQRRMPTIQATPDEAGHLDVAVMSQGDDWFPAMVKAYGDQFVEVFSERTGEVFGVLGRQLGPIFAKMPIAQRVAGMKAALLARWFEKTGTTRVRDALARLADRAAWHGMLGEMFEERVADVMRPLLGLGEFQMPSLKQLAAEALAFAVPGAIGNVARAGEALATGERRQPRARQFTPEQLSAGLREPLEFDEGVNLVDAATPRVQPLTREQLSGSLADAPEFEQGFDVFEGIRPPAISALFAGYQERVGGKPPIPLFHIEGGPRGKSTVGLETLQAEGIKPPDFPTPAQWVRQTGRKLAGVEPEGMTDAERVAEELGEDPEFIGQAMQDRMAKMGPNPDPAAALEQVRQMILDGRKAEEEAAEAARKASEAAAEPETEAGPTGDTPEGAGTAERHSYSSTQVNLPRRTARQVLSLAGAIAEEDLAGDGRETQPHMTVQYGIESDDAGPVRAALEGEGPIKVTLGRISTFPPSEGSDGAEVVKIDVEASPDLLRVREKIRRAIGAPGDTFPTYQPHITLAYVKPGTAGKYTGSHAMEGKTITLKSIVFSDRSRNIVEIPLTGTGAAEEAASKTAPKGGEADVPRETEVRGQEGRQEGEIAPQTTPEPGQVEPRAPQTKPKKSVLEGLSAEKQARAAELKKKILDNLGRAQAGPINTEVFAAGVELGALYLEAGVRAFPDFARSVVDDLGAAITPYLKAIYKGAGSFPGVDREGMTPDAEVDSADLDAILAPAEEEQDGEAEPTGAGQPGEPGGEPDLQGPAEGPGGEPPAGVPGEDEGGEPPRVSTGADEGGAAGDGGSTGRQPRRRSGRRAGGRAGGPDGGARGAGEPEPRGTGPTGETGAGVPGQPGREASDLPVDARNHRIAADDTLAAGGMVTRFRANIAALKLVQRLEAENRHATPEEKRTLAKWVGWGGMKEALNQAKADSLAFYETNYPERIPEDVRSWNERYGAMYRELEGLLDETEFRKALVSAENAHYTSREVIEEGLWNIATQLGFKGGRVLENSAGAGHVLGLTPESLVGKVQWTAVERDSITARILAKLYPEARTIASAFEDARIANNSHDLVIGNFPFSSSGTADTRYPAFNLHNYFFARSIDIVRPGGLIVAITSAFSMDSPGSKAWREWMAERADLVGAIRLPNTAFKKSSNTEVTSDILVFRKKTGAAFPLAQRFMTLLRRPVEGTSDEVTINEYFASKPEMMLGKMTLGGKMRRGGGDEQTLEPTGELVPQLRKAVGSLPQGVYGVESAEGPAVEITAAEEGALEYSYQLDEAGNVRQVRDGLLVDPEWAGDARKMERAKAWLELRDTTVKLTRGEISEHVTDDELAVLRARLNEQYDAYVKAHGRLGEARSAFLSEDPDFGRTAALEEIENRVEKDKKTGKLRVKQFYSKAAIFERRITWPRREPTSAENIRDAIAISSGWRGHVDVPFVARLLGVTPEEAIDQGVAEGLIFYNHATGLVEEAGQFLSGNVRAKLHAAERELEGKDLDEKARQWVEQGRNALRDVQPADVKIEDINVRFGSKWLPGKVYERFLGNLMEQPDIRAAKVSFSHLLGLYSVEWSPRIINTTPNTNTYAGGGRPAMWIIERLINMKPVVVMRAETDENGRERLVRDQKATEEAEAAASKIKEQFAAWFHSADAAPFYDELARVYNDTFNAYVDRVWEPAPFDYYPGANQEIRLRAHQSAAVQRGLRESFLMGHSVGTGKTFAFITLAMEARRLGNAKKPVIVAHNPTVPQIVASVGKLYPWARVLAPTKADFTPKNRRRLMARIQTGDYDVIVLAQSQFNMIKDSVQRQEAYINAEIAVYREELVLVSAREGKQSPQARDLSRRIRSLEKQLSKLLSRNVDEFMTFEELGIDMLIVDEAHAYKKRQFVSVLPNMKGLDRSFSQRGLSLALKADFVREMTGGKNIVMATGTLISNTVAEAWNMIRYVRPELLGEFRVEHFDEFFANFLDTIPKFVTNAAQQWVREDRLATYTNLPELQRLWKTAVDVILPGDVDIPRPIIETGGPQIVEIERSEILGKFITFLADWYAHWKDLTAKERREQSAVPLVIMTLAKQAAIDLRLINPNVADDPASKVNVAVDRVFQIWESGKEERLTQVIFSDTFQSRGVDAAKRPIPRSQRFNLYEDIKAKLVARGVPEGEIAIITEHDTDAKREILFDQMNLGNVRILMGSTEKLGVGVNVQERLVAAHHLDVPMRPMDIEQRDGRIWRQGNRNERIQIIRYGVKNTLDSSGFLRLATKQGFINELMKGQAKGRNVDLGEEAEISYEQFAAAVSGDTRVLEKFALQQEIAELETLERVHRSEQERARSDMATQSARLETLQRTTPQFAASIERVTSALGEGVESYRLVIGEGEAAELDRKGLVDAIDALFEEWSKRLVDVGKAEGWADYLVGSSLLAMPMPALELNGIEISLRATDTISRETEKPLGEIHFEWSVELVPGRESMGGSVQAGRGFMQSLAGKVGGLDVRLQAEERRMEQTATNVEQLRAIIGRPFQFEQRLEDTRNKFNDLLAELAASGGAVSSPESKGMPEPPFEIGVGRDGQIDVVDEAETEDEEEPEEDAMRAPADAMARASRPRRRRLPTRVEPTAARNAPLKWSNVPIGLDFMGDINPLELPELVRLVRELTGGVPDLKRLRGNALGKHRAGKITLDFSNFEDPLQAAQTLAHEIGHLVDWLPDETMKRGNLLGRLHSLRGFMRQTFGRSPKDKEIREELKILTGHWRPFDPEADAAYTKYRYSSRELYADFVSVMLIAPGLAQHHAEKTYRVFMEQLGRKPEVQEAYIAIQDLIKRGGPEVSRSRIGRQKAAFQAAEEKRAEKEQEAEARKEGIVKQLLRNTRAHFVDKNLAVLDRVGRFIDQTKLTPDKNPRLLLEEQAMMDARNHELIRRIDKNVLRPFLEATGMNDAQARELFGLYLTYKRIASGDRSQIANPAGETAKTAQDNLDTMAADLGEGTWNALERAMKGFHDLIFPLMQEATEAGIYSRQAFVETILPNRDTYATFEVTDYLETKIAGTMKTQRGTFRDIANPFVSTMLKAATLNRLIMFNRAKRSVVDTWGAAGFEIEKSQRGRTPEGRETYFRPNKDPRLSGRIELFEDGQLVGYDVDPYVAKVFEIRGAEDHALIFRALSWINHRAFHPIFITFSLAFHSRNFWRDLKRSWKSGEKLGEILAGYVRAAGPAWARARGIDNELLSEIISKGALDIPFTESLAGIAADDTYERLLRRMALGEESLDQRRPMLWRTLLAPFSAIKLAGDFIEALPKVSGYDIRRRRFLRDQAEHFRDAILRSRLRKRVGKALGLQQDSAGDMVWTDKAKTRLYDALQAYILTGKQDPAIPRRAYEIWRVKYSRALGIEGHQIAYQVRNYVGTPNWRRAGYQTYATNALFLYSNVALQGFRADKELATQPSTRGGWWMKTFLVDVLPTVAIAAGAAGMFGDDVEEWLAKIGSYDLTNYTPLPLGWFVGEDGRKKAAYIRIPHDEAGRAVKAVLWAILQAGMKENRAPIRGVLDVGADQVPVSLAPPIELVMTWAQFLVGRNPEDSFTGRPIIPQTAFTAGFGGEQMVEWTLEQFGEPGSIATTLMKMARPSADEKGTLETGINLTPGLRSIVKVTDFGEVEEEWRLEDLEAREKARFTESLPDEARDLVRRFNRLNRKGEERRTPVDEANRAALSRFYRTYLKSREQLREATTDAQKGLIMTQLRMQADQTRAALR